MAFEHFIAAQDPVFERVKAELAAGRKTTHWMWFVFPQIAGLGASAMSQRFALHSLQEARAYLAHPLLGPRLAECARLVNAHADMPVGAIFGHPDDMKFHSSMTLFARAAPDEPIFREALAIHFDGREDEATLRLLDDGGAA